MKTRKEVKDIMTAEYIKSPVIQQAYGLTPGKTFTEQFSLVSIENILFDVISYPIWLLMQFFSKHEHDIDQKIMQQKTGRLSWYQYMMLNYQDGFELLPESDQFNNANASEETIQASKKIKHSRDNLSVILNFFVCECLATKKVSSKHQSAAVSYSIIHVYCAVLYHRQVFTELF